MRPTKEPEELRDMRLNLRLTAAELAHVQQQAKAAGLTPSDYARRRVVGHRVTVPTARMDAAILSELNRIGVNLNQITRAANAGGSVDHAGVVLDEITQLIARIAEVIE